MAKFYAVTDIKFGKRTEDGSSEGKYERKTFKAGDEVTGLSKEDMKGLWEAGALEQRGDQQEQKVEEQPEAPKTETPKPKPVAAPKGQQQ